jgi:hypothetical protein
VKSRENLLRGTVRACQVVYNRPLSDKPNSINDNSKKSQQSSKEFALNLFNACFENVRTPTRCQPNRAERKRFYDAEFYRLELLVRLKNVCFIYGDFLGPRRKKLFSSVSFDFLIDETSSDSKNQFYDSFFVLLRESYYGCCIRNQSLHIYGSANLSTLLSKQIVSVIKRSLSNVIV